MKAPKKTTTSLFFLDSGAHSLFNEHVYVTQKGLDFEQRYSYYRTQAFWDYVDAYAQFVKEHKDHIDLYVNVDVIHHPDLTWEVQKYLENEHGLDPVPVVHSDAPLSVMQRYLDAGYEYIGLGGVARESNRTEYVKWADAMYDLICSTPDRRPRVKTHGFAMTSYSEMIRYPWYSTDSSSWAKSAAFGSIFVPHKRKGKFTFGQWNGDILTPVDPYVIGFSNRTPRRKREFKKIVQDQIKKDYVPDEFSTDQVNGVFTRVPAGLQSSRHFNSLTTVNPETRRIVLEWLDKIEVPLGKNDKDGNTVEEGVLNHYGSRGIANLRFFEELCKWLPEWPWPFRKPESGGEFS